MPRTAAFRFAAPLLAALAVATVACSGERPTDIGVQESGLLPCPSSPNCVSSDATDEEHGIEALAFSGSAATAWQAAVAVVGGWPRTEIITETGDYLHAECTSRLMRYVDDLELHLQPESGVIAVRSASRVGQSDLGVNRQRVEDLRAALREASSSP